MTNSNLLLLARVLLSAIFIIAGFGKFGNIDGTAAYISSVGLPMGKLLAIATAIFELAGGLAILVGYQTRIAALLLAAFCVVSALLFHFKPDDQAQFIQMMKNFAMAGGFLALANSGAGPLSLDGRKK